MASWKQGKIKFGFLETASSGGTLTLTVSSLQYQIITGTLAHTVQLPVATTMATGLAFNIVNASTGIVTVKLADGTTTQATLASGQGAAIFLTDASTSNGVWSNKTGSAGAGSGFGAGVVTPTVTTGNRAMFGGGNTGSQSAIIDYVIISTLGSGASFGNLTSARQEGAACSSSTRGVFAGGGGNGSPSNLIEYVTISTLANAVSFGVLTGARNALSGLSNSTRGVFGGGYNGGYQTTIDYITIASTGNATSFGALTVATAAKGYMASCASSTRGVFAGGNNGTTAQATMEYVTIASTGNSTSFGALSANRYGPTGFSNSTRGVFAGGSPIGGPYASDIYYITIATTGNSVSFGNLTLARGEMPGGAASSSRGLVAGGYTGAVSLVIDSMTIATTSNADSFGSLTAARYGIAGCSDSHGGL